MAVASIGFRLVLMGGRNGLFLSPHPPAVLTSSNEKSAAIPQKNILQFQKSLSGSFKDKLSWLDKPQPPLRRKAYRTGGTDVTPGKQFLRSFFKIEQTAYSLPRDAVSSFSGYRCSSNYCADATAQKPSGEKSYRISEG